MNRRRVKMCTIKTAAGHVCTPQHPQHPPTPLKCSQCNRDRCALSRVPPLKKTQPMRRIRKKCVSSPLEKVLEYHKELLQLAEIVQKLDRADASEQYENTALPLVAMRTRDDLHWGLCEINPLVILYKYNRNISKLFEQNGFPVFLCQYSCQ